MRQVDPTLRFYNPDDLYPGEPTVCFRAADLFLPWILNQYAGVWESSPPVDQDLIDKIAAVAATVVAWQAQHGTEDPS